MSRACIIEQALNAGDRTLSMRSRTTCDRRMFIPDDPLFNLQWNLSLIEMERAWDISPAAGGSVTIAVIDSGLAFKDTRINFKADEFSLRGVSVPALGTVTVPFSAAFDIVSRRPHRCAF